MNDEKIPNKLEALGLALVDQKKARRIVEPHADRSGYWFGGGNLCLAADGSLLLVGRYRNAGDSTYGLSKGERGAELAVFESRDRGAAFHKVLSFSKADLAVDGREVLSIEGAALSAGPTGFELFVSTEKAGVEYPAGLESYRKPGTGVWSIDRLAAPTLDGLAARTPEPLDLKCDPGNLHIKDPGLFRAGDGSVLLFFCSHPFSWSSSNSGYAIRPAGSACFGEAVHEFFARGNCWDVAAARMTDVLTLPGELFGRGEAVNLVFYDGAECLRQLPESPNAVRRPRGFSCEELGGLAWFSGGDFPRPRRISLNQPLFVSPWGTGCCRYIHACPAPEGIYAVWQQGQASGAQPLVMNFLAWDEVRRIVGGA
jgi:hypothetical protein